MAWDAFEDHLAEVRKGSVPASPTRTTVANGWFTEKVPGEDRIPEVHGANASGQATQTNDRAETLDQAELDIIKSYDKPAYQIKTYRRAKAAWAEFKDRPPTAIQAYSLLKEVEQSYRWMDTIDISPAEFYKTLAHQAQRAVSEMTLQIGNLNPEGHYNNYKFYSLLYDALYDAGRRDDDSYSADIIIALNPSIDFYDVLQNKNERQKRAEAASILRVIGMYRQGLKAGSAEMDEFHGLFEEFDMGFVLWRTVPEKGSSNYDRWLRDIENIGLSAEEGAGIVNLIAALNRQEQEIRQKENDQLRSLRPQPYPHP